MEENKGFVIRVYGLYVDINLGLLVSDEYVYNQSITKFPGGGLEFGEGPIDCLIREMKEEMDMTFEITDHFYTTDFFVESVFNKNIQVLSIYYLMKPVEELKVQLANKPFDFEKKVNGAQRFRFIPLSEISEISLTLIIDRKVAQMVKERYQSH